MDKLSTADQYITKDVPAAAAGLYEVTITDQNFGCSVTSIGLIEVDAVDLPVTVAWAQPQLQMIALIVEMEV